MYVYESTIKPYYYSMYYSIYTVCHINIFRLKDDEETLKGFQLGSDKI